MASCPCHGPPGYAQAWGEVGRADPSGWVHTAAPMEGGVCPNGRGISQVDCGLVGEKLGAPRGSNCLSCPRWLHRAISHAAPSVFCLPQA